MAQTFRTQKIINMVQKFSERVVELEAEALTMDYMEPQAMALRAQARELRRACHSLVDEFALNDYDAVQIPEKVLK